MRYEVWPGEGNESNSNIEYTSQYCSAFFKMNFRTEQFKIYASRRVPGGDSSNLRIAADMSGVSIGVSILQKQYPTHLMI